MKYLIVVGSAFLIGSATAFAPRNVGSVARFHQQTLASPTALQAVELSQDVLVAGGAALAGIAFALTAAGGKGAAEPKVASVVAAPKVEPVDVSIPYDAAARLLYGEMNGAKVDEATFQKFKQIYITKAVAQVTAKKVARDAALDADRFAAIAAQADKDMALLV